MKMQCYYCDGEHSIDTCEKFKKDKVRYNLSKAETTMKYYKWMLKITRKSSMTINEAAFFIRPQELIYSI